MNVYERLEIHYAEAEKFALSHYCEIISVCLRGSQNYGLSDENSDVDTIAFIVPEHKFYYLFDKPISKELHIDDEHCVVKDVRFLCDELIKGSPNMIEAIMTDFYIDNPKYHDIMEKIRERRESYARINQARTIKALCGMGFSPTGKNYHAEKNLEMINRYIAGKESYKDILIPKDIPHMLEVKRKNYKNLFICDGLKAIQKNTKESDYEINKYSIFDLKFHVTQFFD